MPKQTDFPDGQSNARDRSAANDQSAAPRAGERAKMGLASDKQPELVAPTGVNERDHGAADDKPMGGGALNFDDDDQAHPRGNTTRTGGTWNARGADSGAVGRAPGAGLSNRNGPSDPYARRDRQDS